MDRKAIIEKLAKAHADLGQVVDSMIDGDDRRVSWTRLLAHNVNNHLTSIFFIIERFIQPDGMTREKEEAYVNGLKDVAERIQETIHRLMTLSQLDSLVKLATVDVGEAVTEVVGRAEGYASLKKIDLKAKVPAGPILAQADRVGLVESVLNLIGNAIKYSPPGTRVDVGVSVVGGNVEIRVRDQGPGIDREEQSKLFKVGGVLSTKPTGGEPQTGIGLAMSQALIREMGGSIWCESETGKGAMFGIRLPLTTPAARARQSSG